MYQGFYNLASGMLTQGRNLNVISNNMVNVQTAGYKHDTMVSTTFEEEMLYRTGRRNKDEPVPLATTSKIRTADQTYVNYESGNIEITDGIFDFAVEGDGFFSVMTPAGERYTRNGSFAVDADGTLILPGIGQVLSTDNQPIRLDDENFSVDSSGNITGNVSVIGEDGLAAEVRQYGTIKVVDFEDYLQLRKETGGMFSTAQAQIPMTGPNGESSIIWKTLERSNVDLVEEMTSMMTSQRALQSASQVLKMYDQIMSKSVTDVGRL